MYLDLRFLYLRLFALHDLPARVALADRDVCVGTSRRMVFRLSTRKHWATGEIIRHVATTLFWMPIPLTLFCHCIDVKQVGGISMQPTLNPDLSKQRDLVLFDRVSVSTLRHYRRGDIIMVRSPYNSEQFLVKRLLALPGDTVKTLPPFPRTEIIVPDGHCWIEGDRSMDSEDSNTIGPIPLALVEARMVTVLLPFSRAWGCWWSSEGKRNDVKIERVSRRHGSMIQ